MIVILYLYNWFYIKNSDLFISLYNDAKQLKKQKEE